MRLAHLTTSTPSLAKREITITLPADGAEVTGSVQVTGNVTIAPFENNLSYSIIDASNAEWVTGPMQVAAPDLGAPGRFDTQVGLSNVPAGTIIFLELQDLGAADGSLLAMDSVQLVVK
ncbi:MAG: Gmad2 immunoglobulin-like domain-containing protein [Chloroflexota bacterium]